MTKEKINILLVDDHSLVLEGMTSILNKIPSIEIAATASNAQDAMTALKSNPISIAFVDVSLPDINGLELCSRIKTEFPEVHVLGLSIFKQRSYVSQMIANGASGYLLKSESLEGIKQAIDDVLSGKMYFSADINNAKVEPVSEDDVPTLTRREKEILKLIAEGMTTNEMADKLFVSPYTVETHRKNLLAKFKVVNTAVLIKTAAAYGLL